MKNSDPDLAKLNQLGAQIEAARHQGDEKGADAGEEQKTRQQSSRAAYDLMAALLVGPGLGWLVDQQFYTAPWGVIVGLAIGFAAGLMNAWRSINGVDQAVGFRHLDGRKRTKSKEKK